MVSAPLDLGMSWKFTVFRSSLSDLGSDRHVENGTSPGVEHSTSGCSTDSGCTSFGWKEAEDRGLSGPTASRGILPPRHQDAIADDSGFQQNTRQQLATAFPDTENGPAPGSEVCGVGDVDELQKEDEDNGYVTASTAGSRTPYCYMVK